MKLVNLFLWPNLDFVSFDQQFPKCIHPHCSSACSFSSASVSLAFGDHRIFVVQCMAYLLCLIFPGLIYVSFWTGGIVPSYSQTHCISTHFSDDETYETDSVFLPLRIMVPWEEMRGVLTSLNNVASSLFPWWYWVPCLCAILCFLIRQQHSSQLIFKQ